MFLCLALMCFDRDVLDLGMAAPGATTFRFRSGDYSGKRSHFFLRERDIRRFI